MADLEHLFLTITGMPINRALPITEKKHSFKCLLPGCDTMTNHNGGYCCSEHCKEHRRRIKEEKK